MVKTILIAIILFVLLAIGALIFVRRPQSGGKIIQVSIGPAVFNSEVADTFTSRAAGLSGRDGLGANEGLLFIFPFSSVQGFWMKGMKFPIDIIWISEGKVIGFSENVPVPQGVSLQVYSSPQEADQVLEINAGLVKTKGIKVGDAVIVGK